MLTIGFIIDIQKVHDIIFGIVIITMSFSIIYSNLLPLLDSKHKKKSGRLMKILSISVIFLIPLMIWIDFMNTQIAGFIVLPLMYLNINVLMIFSEIDIFFLTVYTEPVSLAICYTVLSNTSQPLRQARRDETQNRSLENHRIWSLSLQSSSRLTFLTDCSLNSLNASLLLEQVGCSTQPELGLFQCCI